MVKWKDYNVSDSTWEPEKHLPDSVTLNYIPSSIDQVRLKHFTADFERAVQLRLKSKNPQCHLFADLDVHRHIFGESSRLCELEDFAHLDLSQNWFYNLSKDGHGRKLKFPIRITPSIRMKKIYMKESGKVVTKNVPVEKCELYMCTEACDINDV